MCPPALALEELAARSSRPEAFFALWRRVVELTLASTAFVEVVVEARRQLDGTRGLERLRDLLREPLPRRRRRGASIPVWRSRTWRSLRGWPMA